MKKYDKQLKIATNLLTIAGYHHDLRFGQVLDLVESKLTQDIYYATDTQVEKATEVVLKDCLDDCLARLKQDFPDVRKKSKKKRGK